MSRLRTLGVLFTVLLLFALGGVVGLFLVKNAHMVVIRFPEAHGEWPNPFVFVDWEGPLWVVIVVSFVVGALLATLAYTPLWMRRVVEQSRNRRFIHALEGELSDLRNLPVEDPAPFEDIDEEGPEGETTSEDDEAFLITALQEQSGKPAPGPQKTER